MLKKTVFLILFSIVAITISATIAKPGIGLVGDEYGHWREGEVTPTKIAQAARYRRAVERRIMKNRPAKAPTKGEVRGLVILVNFSDVAFVTPNAAEAFSRMLNQSGYSENHATGSARDYFIASSDSLFKPTFDVYGPYTISKEMAYYGGNDAQGRDNNPGALIEEACEAAEAAGVDFGPYDADNDGYLDNVFVYYAGHNEAEGGPENSIWPHRSALLSSNAVGGKDIYDYACTSELSGSEGSQMCGIGTFCHEFGHVLGLPDFYNTRSSSTYTIGSWDIMCQGNYNNHGRTPPTYSAFARFMVGWLTPTQLAKEMDYQIEPLETSGQAYLIAEHEHNLDCNNLDPLEFWLVENRQRIGWDAPEGCLPGVGLLVSHITHDEGRWMYNTYNNHDPLGFDLCEAYVPNPSVSSSSDTYPGLMNITSFTPTSNVGDTLKKYALSSIRYIGETDIAFHLGGTNGKGFRFAPQPMPALFTEYTADTIIYHVDTLAIKGEHLSSDSVHFKIEGKRFQISLDNKKWGNEFYDVLTADSTYERTIYLRHIPQKQCVTASGTILVESSDHLIQTQLILQGKSARPTLIKPVQSIHATDFTPYTFTAQWKPQADAERYYLTLYKLSEGTTTLTPEPTRSSFNIEGEEALTPTLPVPAQSLRISLTHNYIGTDEPMGGIMIVEGLSNRWRRIDSAIIRPISSAYHRTYNFDEKKKFTRFRFRYHHLGGEGGLQLVRLLVNLPYQLDTISKDEDYPIFAPDSTALVSGLLPRTYYSYQLHAVEEKGCEKHITELGPPTVVKTLIGAENTKRNLTVYLSGEHTMHVYFPTPTQQGDQIGLYDLYGHLIRLYDIEEATYHTIQQVAGLVDGHIYIVKYISGKGLKRKNYWGKFVK